MNRKKIKKDVLHWLGNADEDYISARLLLLNGFLKQGVMLANTSIEKYFKTLLFYNDKTIPHTHDTVNLYQRIYDLISKEDNINKGFIELLSKSYKLRYSDELPIGYNIHLDQIKLLVELDRTVFIIRKKFKFETLDGKRIDTRIDFLIKEKEPILLEKNISYGSYDKIKLFKEKSRFISLLVYGEHNIIESVGGTEGTLDDGKFDIVGIKQN